MPTRRMVFHEITPEAIAHAVDNPRELNTGLVDAYQTRRVLDRLYGYEVSPVLWKKVMPRLSAGRVQSVATRLVVARERERIAFRAARYWDLQAVFARADGAADAGASSFPAGLVAVDGRRVAQGRDFAPSGELRNPDSARTWNAQTVPPHRRRRPRRRRAPAVRRGTRRPAARRGLLRQVGRAQAVPALARTRRSAPPRCSRRRRRKLGFSAKYTMSVAQRLYENGHITYMRTDSTTLSQTAIDAARRQARELYGAEYVPDAPRVYTSKVKNAQEAHEAIRPAGDSFRTPAQSRLSGDELRALRADLEAHGRLADEGRHRGVGVGPRVAAVPPRARTPSSARPGRSSASTAS